MSSVALFIALGGVSYAATQLPDDSVGSNQLRDGAVVNAKIATGSITRSKLVPWIRRRLDAAIQPGPRGAPGTPGADGAPGSPGPGARRLHAIIAAAPSSNYETVFADAGLTIAMGCESSVDGLAMPSRIVSDSPATLFESVTIDTGDLTTAANVSVPLDPGVALEGTTPPVSTTFFRVIGRLLAVRATTTTVIDVAARVDPATNSCTIDGAAFSTTQ